MGNALTEKAKALRSKMAEEMKFAFKKWNMVLVKNMDQVMKEASEGVLGKDAYPKSTKALLSQVSESLGLSTKGVETKLLQKLDETLGTWVASAKKEGATEKRSEL